jgi:hypothetical protein
LSAVCSDDFDIDRIKPLLNAVLSHEPDESIWDEVYGAVTKSNPPTILDKRLNPSTLSRFSIIPTYTGTNIKTKSSRLLDGDKRDNVEKELFVEIQTCIFRDVGCFWDKFFVDQREEIKVMVEKMINTEYRDKRWTGFPANTGEENVWNWQCSLEKGFVREVPFKLHTTTTAHEFKGREEGQVDLFFDKKPAADAKYKPQYENVLVVGELKSSYDTGRFKADLLQFTRQCEGSSANSRRAGLSTRSLCVVL